MQCFVYTTNYMNHAYKIGTAHYDVLDTSKKRFVIKKRFVTFSVALLLLSFFLYCFFCFKHANFQWATTSKASNFSGEGVHGCSYPLSDRKSE